MISPVRRIDDAVRRLARPLLHRVGWRMPRVSAGERIQPSEAGSRVTVRDDETLLVDGTPFFPIGLYYARDEIADLTGAGLRKLRHMG